MIDLHTHSMFSDGTDSPEELARAGEAAGLFALALTDHDTVDGLPRFLSVQSEVRCRLIPGVELGCRFLGKDLHILGLFVDPDAATFKARLQDIRARREDRNDRMAARLQELGHDVDLEWVRSLAPGGLITRTHFAEALVRRQAVQTSQEAFQHWLHEDRPGYVPMKDLSPSEAIQWIHDAGGVAIVAHPGRFGGGQFPWDQGMKALRACGVDGLEAYYGEHSSVQERYFIDLAQRLALAPSGGSDYHGRIKPGLLLGKGRGSLHVPDDLLPELESRRPHSER